jgi:hypothetical protein
MKPFARFFAASALALATVVAAQPADAATITVTWQGTIADGGDAYNTLGAGPVLAGVAAQVVWTFDDATPLSTYTPGPELSRLEGYGARSPGSAVMTVNGVSLNFLGDADSLLTKQHCCGALDAIHASVEDYAAGSPTLIAGWVVIEGLGLDLFDTADLYEPFSADLDGSNNGYVTGYFYLTDATRYIHGNFGSTGHLSWAISGGGGATSAPEPATWAMMLLGFGGMGAVLRRRRAIAV